MARKKTSVREIASICNVSTATVSRVLNNQGNVSDEKKKIILDVARKMGYIIPNEDIKSKKIIGVLQLKIGAPLLTDTESALEVILQDNNYDVLYSSYRLDTPDVESNVKRLVDLYEKIGVDVIVVFLTDVLDLKLETPIPIIYAYLDGNDFLNKKYSVSYDLYIGGKLAAYELLRNGAKNPLVLYNSHFTTSADLRYKGFIEAFKENGINIDSNHLILANPKQKTFQDGFDVVQYLFTKDIPFDCIFAGSDWRAYGALTALQELELKVPEEIKVIGFDGSDIAKYNSIPITSVDLNSYSFAYQTLQLINALINNQPIKEKNIIIPVQLFSGRTT